MKRLNLAKRPTFSGEACYAYCTAKSAEEAQTCEWYENHARNHKNTCKHLLWLSGICDRYYK